MVYAIVLQCVFPFNSALRCVKHITPSSSASVLCVSDWTQTYIRISARSAHRWERWSVPAAILSIFPFRKTKESVESTSGERERERGIVWCVETGRNAVFSSKQRSKQYHLRCFKFKTVSSLPFCSSSPYSAFLLHFILCSFIRSRHVNKEISAVESLCVSLWHFIANGGSYVCLPDPLTRSFSTGQSYLIAVLSWCNSHLKGRNDKRLGTRERKWTTIAQSLQWLGYGLNYQGIGV